MGKYAVAIVGAALVLVIAKGTPLAGVEMSVGAAAATGSMQTSSAMSTESQRSLINQYCLGCHSDSVKAGGLALSQLDLAHVDQHAELAEKVIRKLRAGMMPPPGSSRPDPGTSKAFAATLAAQIDKAAAPQPNPGSRPFQRLSRAEYARSIRDLLEIDADVDALLPPDTYSDGFDNIADAQAFSPALMEGYIRAATKIATDALGDPKATPTSVTHKTVSTASQMRQVEGAPLGTRGGISLVHHFPADGEYTFNMSFFTQGGLIGGGSPNREQIEVSINGQRVALLDIIPNNMSEQSLNGANLSTGRIFVKAGPQRVSAAFVQKFSGLTDDLVVPIEYTLAVSIGGAPILQLPHLQTFNITGPFNVTGVSDTPSRHKVFKCRPVSAAEERPCATNVIRDLARQAYRRPVTEQDLEGLMSFYEAGRKDGDFESGIRTALQAVLASLQFVFRLEQKPTNIRSGEIYRVGDMDLASRLSYFLWSTSPDDELISVAREGRLQDPAELERQVRRMLVDARSESLATRFAALWLRLADLQAIQPDVQRYPQYDYTLAQALRRETELFFDSVLREDRNVLDLLTADYTFVNERLAKHYDIPGIQGSRFQRVTLTEDYRRGLLGQGSILTMTSNADRTSPVIRGKWVMEVLLGTPPPPPPPNVPGLEATKPIKDGRVLTVRERMETHRANPACNSCHRMIDPIGLSLENFDVTGIWRMKDGGGPVDPSTVLFDGTAVNSPAGLRQVILKYSDAFIGTFTENLLTYALGRRVQYYDMPTVRAIASEAARNDNRFSSFVLGIVKSTPFRMKRAEKTEQ